MMTPTRLDTAPYADRLSDAYANYVAGVSAGDHAVSLETAAMIWWYCDHIQAASVCDLGSGFSSHVLRAYAASADHRVQVVSVDTDADWLDKTIGFMRECDEPGAFILLDDWLASDAQFDLIFHDIANGEQREALMATAAARLNPGGVLILDDAQNASHHAEMVRLTDELGWALLDTKQTTLDHIERFALVATSAASAQLAADYQRVSATPSDIYEHLPTFVRMVLDLDAKHVIELGTRTGVSTIAWLYALERTGGRLTSVDIDAKPPIGDYDHWTFIQGDDLDPAVYAQLEPADVVFVDTSHLYDQTVHELNLYRWLVKPGGVMVLHDTELPQPEGAPPRPQYPVKTAIVEFCEANGYEWTNRTNCWGLGIIQF